MLWIAPSILRLYRHVGSAERFTRRLTPRINCVTLQLTGVQAFSLRRSFSLPFLDKTV